MMEKEETEESLREYLNSTGILNAYEDLLLKLLASGPPQHGNVFSFAADEIVAWRDGHLDDELEFKDFVKNKKQTNGTHVYANKTLDKLKHNKKPTKNKKQYESDSDGDYDFNRSTSIVRIKQPISQQLPSISPRKTAESMKTNTQLRQSERAQSDSDEDFSPSPSYSLQRATSLEKRSQNGNGADTGITRSTSGKRMDATRSASTQDVDAIPRSSSNKSVSSLRSTSNHDIPSLSIQRSASTKSVGSHHSSTPSTPRDASMKSTGSNHDLPRSISAKSVESYHSSSAQIARSASNKSVGSAKSVDTPRSGLVRSGSIKSVDTPRSDLSRSASNKSIGSSKSMDSPRSDLVRSGSVKSVDSRYEIQRTSSTKSVETSPRARVGPPAIQTTNLTRSSSAKSDLATPLVTPLTTPITPSRQFFFTVTSEENTEVLAKAAIPRSHHPSITKNPSLTSFPSILRPPVPLAAIPTSPTPGFDYAPHRRASNFSEEDIVKPDMSVINSQIADTYGSSESDVEEVDEEDGEDEGQEILDEDLDIHKPIRRDSFPKTNPLRRSSIFEEAPEIFNPAAVQFDEGIEDTYDIEDDRASSGILSNDDNGDFESEHENENEKFDTGENDKFENDDDFEFEYDERTAETEEIDAHEPSDEEEEHEREIEEGTGHIQTLNNVRIDMSKVYGRDTEPGKDSGSGRGSVGESESGRGSGPNSLRSAGDNDRQIASSGSRLPQENTREQWHKRTLSNSFELNIDSSDPESDYSPSPSPTVAPFPANPSFPLKHASSLSSTQSYTSRDEEEEEESYIEEEEGEGEGEEEYTRGSARKGLNFNYNYGDLDRELEEMDGDIDKLDELDYLEFKTPKQGVSRQARTYEDEYDSDAS